MKILIFEYLCGGGFSQQPLPPSLATEGRLMLHALLADFAALPEHEIIIMQDWRESSKGLPAKVSVVWVSAQQQAMSVFQQILPSCDAVWLIAPETDNVLFDFAQQVEKSRKLALSSPSSAIAKTADKWQTFQLLSAQGIATVATQCLLDYDGSFRGATVVKSRDGVGCENSWFFATAQALAVQFSQIKQPDNAIIQPYLVGEALSLSVLFKKGIGHLLCVNRQKIQLENQQFRLLACEVNCQATAPYQALVKQIAAALPDLYGYVGIDLIQQDKKLWVLEINPRLTSSYAGIAPALGINVAAAVLGQGTEQLQATSNQVVKVTLAQDRENDV